MTNPRNSRKCQNRGSTPSRRRNAPSNPVVPTYDAVGSGKGVARDDDPFQLLVHEADHFEEESEHSVRHQHSLTFRLARQDLDQFQIFAHGRFLWECRTRVGGLYGKSNFRMSKIIFSLTHSPLSLFSTLAMSGKRTPWATAAAEISAKGKEVTWRDSTPPTCADVTRKEEKSSILPG